MIVFRFAASLNPTTITDSVWGLCSSQSQRARLFGAAISCSIRPVLDPLPTMGLPAPRAASSGLPEPAVLRVADTGMMARYLEPCLQELPFQKSGQHVQNLLCILGSSSARPKR